MDMYTKIKEAAEEKGYSIRALEVELGFGNGSLSRLRGDPKSATRIKKLCQYLSLSSDYLLGLTEEKSPSMRGGPPLESFLSTIGWNVSVSSENVYTVENDTLTVNFPAEKYAALEKKIESACTAGILSFVTDSVVG